MVDISEVLVTEQLRNVACKWQNTQFVGLQFTRHATGSKLINMQKRVRYRYTNFFKLRNFKIYILWEKVHPFFLQVNIGIAPYSTIDNTIFICVLKVKTIFYNFKYYTNLIINDLLIQCNIEYTSIYLETAMKLIEQLTYILYLTHKHKQFVFVIVMPNKLNQFYYFEFDVHLT